MLLEGRVGKSESGLGGVYGEREGIGREGW